MTAAANRQRVERKFEGAPMKEILIFLAFIGFYFLMQLVILPKLGIST